MLERETPLPVDVMVAESLISINIPACHAIFFLLCYFVHGHLSLKKKTFLRYKCQEFAIELSSPDLRWYLLPAKEELWVR